ncbi:hypothetical protein EYF80_067254 [Liparis tanakae]|uniref:Uncharacterized protein n=1 Tax=Liparis tanakae TaxID=230148 RepID=A0A4Z2E2M2_9TELE|nr:hypothetical protein EYF80_067254 [Liparis tanakae]
MSGNRPAELGEEKKKRRRGEEEVHTDLNMFRGINLSCSASWWQQTKARQLFSLNPSPRGQMGPQTDTLHHTLNKPCAGAAVQLRVDFVRPGRAKLVCCSKLKDRCQERLGGFSHTHEPSR